MKAQNIKVSSLRLNRGQIEGVPKNPRFIKDDRFKTLVKSIKDYPEMLKYREVIAYDNNGELVVVCGNMRLRACKELKIKEVPCKILPKSTKVDKIRELLIKDNISFGSDDADILANEFDIQELTDWGIEFPEINLDAQDVAKEKGDGMTDKFQLILDFESQEEVKLEYEKLRKEGYKCRVVM